MNHIITCAHQWAIVVTYWHVDFVFSIVVEDLVLHWLRKWWGCIAIWSCMALSKTIYLFLSCLNLAIVLYIGHVWVKIFILMLCCGDC